MSRKLFLVQDPAMAAISDRITELMGRIDQLITTPDTAAEERLIADVEAMKRDLDAELIMRSPPPGWGELERRASQINH